MASVLLRLILLFWSVQLNFAAQGVLATCYTDVAGRTFAGHRTIATFSAYRGMGGTDSIWGLKENYNCSFTSRFVPPFDLQATFRLTLDDVGLFEIKELWSNKIIYSLQQSSCCGPVTRETTVSLGMYSGYYQFRVSMVNFAGNANMKLEYQYTGASSVTQWSVISPQMLTMDDSMASAHNIPAAQIAALAPFYTFTKPWGSLSQIGWDQYETTPLQYAHPCGWLGVECSFFDASNGGRLWVSYNNAQPNGNVGSTYITDIMLAWRSLRGNFTNAASKFNLFPRLNRMQLAQNLQLYGALPPSWNGWTSLTILDISVTGLTLKNLPALGALATVYADRMSAAVASNLIDEAIGNAANLTTLRMTGNALSTIPFAIGTLKRLNLLDLTDNNIGSISSALCYLDSLTTLRLTNNNISVVDECFLTSLPSLTTLDIRANRAVYYMPDTVQGNLSSLTTLDVSDSRIAGIGGLLWGSSRLQSFNISYSKLTSLHVGSFNGSAKPRLTSLEITNCPLEGRSALPPGLFTPAALPALQVVTITDAPGLLEIPDVVNISTLRLVKVYRTGITSSPLLRNLGAVQTVDMGENPSLAVFPGCLAALPALVTVTMVKNNLSWFDPLDHFYSNRSGFFPSLQVLDLRHNNLGSIPPELAYAPRLSALWLSDNQLGCSNSSLPMNFSASNTNSLSLSNNPLSCLPSVIPTMKISRLECTNCKWANLFDSLCGMRTLRQLVVAKNGLVEIPACFANSSTLTTIDVSENRIAMLPAQLLPREMIYNSTNCTVAGGGGGDAVCDTVMVTVVLPPEVSDPFPALDTFLASFNLFTLDSLDVLTRIKNLRTLDLRGNAIYGSLPDTLLRLTKLVNLDLSNNYFISTPPTGFRAAATREDGQLSNTTVAALPSFLRYMSPTLQSLNLSLNGLSGTLDADLLHLQTSGWPFAFDVRWNAFACPLPSFSGCPTSQCQVSACVTVLPSSVWPVVMSSLDANALTLKGSGFTRTLVCLLVPLSDPHRTSQANALYISDAEISCTTPANQIPQGIVILRLAETSQQGVFSRPLPALSFVAGCPPGYERKADSSEGQRICSPCPAGTFSSAYNSAGCLACGVGFEAPNAGAVECTACAKGFYAPVPGLARCRSCAPGNFSSIIGSGECARCSPGSMSAASESSTCLTCPAGRFAEGYSSQSCDTCGQVGFSTVEGSPTCTPCPANSRSRVDEGTKVSDCLCVAGFYGPAGGPCLPCPVGAYCPGMTVSMPKALPGYWLDDVDPATLYKCTPAEACGGFTSTSNATCLTGYTGRICSQCEPLKYYRLSGICEPCPKLASLMWVLMVAVAFGACAFILRISQPRDMKLYSPSIALTFIQLLALFHGFSVDWPDLVLATYSLASSSNLNIELFSPECSIKLDFWRKYAFQAGMPFFFATILLSYYFALPCYHASDRSLSACKNRCERDRRTAPCARRCGACKKSIGELSSLIFQTVLNGIILLLSWVLFVAVLPIATVLGGLGVALFFVGRFLLNKFDSCLMHRCSVRAREAHLRATVHRRLRANLIRRHAKPSLMDRCRLRSCVVYCECMTFLCCGCSCISLGPPQKRAVPSKTVNSGGSQKEGPSDSQHMSVANRPPFRKQRFSTAATATGLIVSSYPRPLRRNSKSEAKVPANRSATGADMFQLPVLAKDDALFDAEGVFKGRSVLDSIDALRRTATGWGTVGDEETWAANPLRKLATVEQPTASSFHSQLECTVTSSVPDAKLPVSRASVWSLMKTTDPRGRSLPSPSGHTDAGVASVHKSASRASWFRSLRRSASEQLRSSRKLTKLDIVLPGENSAVFDAPVGKRARSFALQRRRRTAGMGGTMIVSSKASHSTIAFGLAPWQVLRSAFSAPSRSTVPASNAKLTVVVSNTPAPARGSVPSQDLCVTDPSTQKQVSIPSWKLNLLPRNADEIDLIRRFEISPTMGGRFIYATMSLLTVGYTFLASAAMEPLNCVELPNKTWVLKASKDVMCYTSEYNSYLPIVIIVNIVYVLCIPCFIFWTIFRAKVTGRLGTPEFDYRYGSLTLPYTKDAWYWELLNTVRKLVVIIVVQFLGRDGTVESTLTQLMVCMTVFSAYTLAQVFVGPYTYAANNRLSLMTNITLLFCLFSGLLYVNPNLGSLTRNSAAVATVIVVVGCGVVIVWTLASEYRRAKARQETGTALGLNRYQLAAMEKRLIDRMFPHSSSRVMPYVSQLNDVDKDAFVRDCLQLLALMPTSGLNPLDAIKAAQVAAGMSSAGGRQRSASMDASPTEQRVVWTGRNVEMVSLSHNPLHSPLGSDSPSNNRP